MAWRAAAPAPSWIWCRHDVPVAATLESYLGKAPQSYEVATIGDGVSALIQIGNWKPHVVLLDIIMPGMDGLEVCRKIKSNEDTKETKIIVLSAYLDEEKFKEMKAHGADICFSKPLPLPQLKEEVARLLDLK